MSDERPNPDERARPEGAAPGALPVREAGVRPAPGAPPERRPAGPRRPRAGMRLRSRGGEIQHTAASRAFLAAVERDADEEALGDGRLYAQQGQVVLLELETGLVSAKVQGSRPRPYATQIAFRAFTAQEWDAIVSAQASEAIHLARLLGGELPETLPELLARMGLSLLPGERDPVEIRCTCRRPMPCKHAVAVGWLVSERIADEPLLPLALRGMAAPRLIERVRQARALRTHGRAAAHSDPLVPESQLEPAPLAECIDDFWRPAAPLDVLDEPPQHHLRHALLRRLGPSRLAGRFPLVGLLQSIYDEVERGVDRDA